MGLINAENILCKVIYSAGYCRIAVIRAWDFVPHMGNAVFIHQLMIALGEAAYRAVLVAGAVYKYVGHNAVGEADFILGVGSGVLHRPVPAGDQSGCGSYRAGVSYKIGMCKRNV